MAFEFNIFGTLVLVLVVFSMFAIVRNVKIIWKLVMLALLLIAYYFLEEMYFMIFAFFMILVFFQIKRMTQFTW